MVEGEVCRGLLEVGVPILSRSAMQLFHAEAGREVSAWESVDILSHIQAWLDLIKFFCWLVERALFGHCSFVRSTPD